MASHDDFLDLVQKHKAARASFNLSSRVVEDLGIDGDDAEELIEALNAKFHPQELSENWSTYFHSEGELLSASYYLKLLAHKIGIRKSPLLRAIEPLTVKKRMELYHLQPSNV